MLPAQKPTFMQICVWIIATIILFTSNDNAWSQISSESNSAKAMSPIVDEHYLLDGKQFKAGIVRADADEEKKKSPLGDLLIFNEGKFSSVVCKKYNFAAAPYQVSKDGDQVHFSAVLHSPTDGKMAWKGIIRGDSLEGTMHWTKKRWYWTIDVEHKIVGKLEVGLNSGSSPLN